LILVRASLDLASYLIAATALAVSLLTLFSMAKIWGGAFWGTQPQPIDRLPSSVFDSKTLGSKTALYLPMVVLALLTLTIGLMAEPVMDLATQAADQLLHPTRYVRAVLEVAP
jgi:multicomponent Na+:H+ antiporter subunit D